MSEIIKWVSNSGNTTILSHQKYYDVLFLRKGAFAPPISINETFSPGVEGSVVRSVQVMPRDLDLAVIVKGDDLADLRTRVRSLLSDMFGYNGQGKLQVSTATGTVRQLNCYVTKGFEGEENEDVSGTTYQKFVFTFHAPSPYWEDLQDTVSQKFITSSNPTSITYNGTAETWPVITINAPWSGWAKVGNWSNTLTINTGLSTGYIKIDTRPGYKSIKDNNGNNMMSYIDNANFFLFTLTPGNNSIWYQLSSTTNQNAAYMSMTYRNRYLGV